VAAVLSPGTSTYIGAVDTREVEPVAAQVPASKTGAPVLSVQNLDVKYGAVQAVSGVSFDVRAGEIVGLIGPERCGKDHRDRRRHRIRAGDRCHR
jgi:ABC-type uncharacterized transport system ATPase subunit